MYKKTVCFSTFLFQLLLLIQPLIFSSLANDVVRNQQTIHNSNSNNEILSTQLQKQLLELKREKRLLEQEDKRLIQEMKIYKSQQLVQPYFAMSLALQLNPFELDLLEE